MQKEIGKLIEAAISALKKELRADFEMPKIEVTHPKDERFGDYTSNVSMLLGKLLGKNPLEVAKLLQEKITADYLEKVEVAAPGYLNFYLTREYLQKEILRIVQQGGDYGNNQMGAGQKILLEFISSNPTGPIHLGNARGGPLGDSIANVLQKAGCQVEREFYVNDFGNQVVVLGHSVLHDAEAQYPGGYIDELGKIIPSGITDPKAVGIWAAGEIIENMIKPTCGKLGIKFDRWFSEKSLHDTGKVDEGISLLTQKGLTYQKDGALWFKSTEFGDDKDRVLVKSDGNKTYIAPDFAYHIDKLDRGYDKLINILGADHHKEAMVMQSFVDRVLGKPGKLEVILTQIVRVMKDGQEVKMSKRRGTYYAMDDLIEEIGKDAVRFISASSAPTSHINFDINLALEQSDKNPVFYVQYAHARVCNIEGKAREAGIEIGKTEDANLNILEHEKELALMRDLHRFPELIEEIAGDYGVHKLPFYAIKLADRLHSFYDACRVVDDQNLEMTKARLELVAAVRIVLAETLRLIGVSAPERM